MKAKPGKIQLYIKMLKRENGASVEELAQAAVKQLGADLEKSRATARAQIYSHLPKKFEIEKIPDTTPTRFKIVKEKKD